MAMGGSAISIHKGISVFPFNLSSKDIKVKNM